MLVSEIMSRPAVSCGVRESLNTAAQLMWDHDCGAIPITEDDGRVVGIVTDRDVCMAAYTQGRSLGEIPVAQVMSKDVLSCQMNDYVAVAERLMRDRQVRRIPVTDRDGRLAGMLSLNDMARYAAQMRRTDGAGDRALVETLAAICRPRSASVQAMPTSPILLA